MKKDKRNEELQSRRGFFKKAARSTLPILGAIALVASPVISYAAKTPMGCEWKGCSGTCQGTCSGTCAITCVNSCPRQCGGCDGGCSGNCWGCTNSCLGSCYKTCLGGAEHQNK